MLSLLRTRTTSKRRTIIVGLKEYNCSREILLRLLNLVVMSGDNVLTVHVQQPDVDFQVKVCTGNSYIIRLSHQVRINFATIFAVGCSIPWPNDSTVSKYLKSLSPTCSLLIMNSGGRILIQMPGTSQQGSPTPNRVLQSSLSTPAKSNCSDQSGKRCLMQKSLSMTSSLTSPSLIQTENPPKLLSVKKKQQPEFMSGA